MHIFITEQLLEHQKKFFFILHKIFSLIDIYSDVAKC